MLLGHLVENDANTFNRRSEGADNSVCYLVDQHLFLLVGATFQNVDLGNGHKTSLYEPGRDRSQALVANADVVTGFDGDGRGDTPGHDEGACRDVFAPLRQQVRQHGDA